MNVKCVFCVPLTSETKTLTELCSHRQVSVTLVRFYRKLNRHILMKLSPNSVTPFSSCHIWTARNIRGEKLIFLQLFAANVPTNDESRAPALQVHTKFLSKADSLNIDILCCLSCCCAFLGYMMFQCSDRETVRSNFDCVSAACCCT